MITFDGRFNKKSSDGFLQSRALVDGKRWYQNRPSACLGNVLIKNYSVHHNLNCGSLPLNFIAEHSSTISTALKWWLPARIRRELIKTERTRERENNGKRPENLRKLFLWFVGLDDKRQIFSSASFCAVLRKSCWISRHIEDYELQSLRKWWSFVRTTVNKFSFQLLLWLNYSFCLFPAS